MPPDYFRGHFNFIPYANFNTNKFADLKIITLVVENVDSYKDEQTDPSGEYEIKNKVRGYNLQLS